MRDKMAITVLEDEILESLERVDEINNQQPVAANKLKQVSEALETLKQQVQKDTARLEEEVARVMDQLAEAERDLADETKEIYRRVVKHKGEDGMAVAEGGCCGRMSSTIHRQNAVTTLGRKCSNVQKLRPFNL